MSKEITVRNLPTLSELSGDIEKAFKNDQLNLLLNQHPIDKWIKLNKFANNSKYLPIDKVEFLLTRIFQNWKVEVLNYSQLFNAVSCSIRLHYVNPIDGQWTFHDGVGAADIQVKAGCSAADLQNINRNAVGMALPIAKSYAIKDASHHIGKIFGKDLNRPDSIEFKGAYDKEITIEDLQELYLEVEHLLSEEEKSHADRIISTSEKNSYSKLFKELTKKKNG